MAGMMLSPGCCCEEASPPVCGTRIFRVSSVCAVSGTPELAAVVLQEGTAEGGSESQTLTFGGTITGGTFTLNVNGFVTAAITWTADDALLLSRIDAALVALANVGPGDITPTARTLSGGHGSVLLAYGGALGNSDRANVIATSSLTGTSPTIAVAELIPGYASRNAVQMLYFGGPATGGTFALSYGVATTGAITWSSTASTLGTNVTSALKALPALADDGFSPRIAINTAGMTGGGGTMTITFINALAAQAVPPIAVAANGLTGTTTVPGLVGATVDLARAGVAVNSGVTGAAGLVRLEIYENGTGYEVSVSGGGTADYYIHNPTATALTCGANSTLAGASFRPRLVPMAWTAGSTTTIAVTGTSGAALGFSDTFSVPGGTTVTTLVPGFDTVSNTFDISLNGGAPTSHNQPGPIFGACGGAYST